VIGLINPCHKPNQKPAGSGPVSTSSFGPAAQAANSNAVPVSSNAHLTLDLIDKTPPRLLDTPVRDQGLAERDWAQSVHSTVLWGRGSLVAATRTRVLRARVELGPIGDH
jgi:hypothetical protein